MSYAKLLSLNPFETGKLFKDNNAMNNNAMNKS